MEARFLILFCVLAATTNATRPPKIKLWFDRPSLRLAISEKATIKCCYTFQIPLTLAWIQNVMITTNYSSPKPVDPGENVKVITEKKEDMICSNLMLKSITLNSTGLYQCLLLDKQSNISTYSPGTFLQVYVPIRTMLNINESSKNSIITAEGVLLLLLVLLPGTMLLCKSKSLNELEKRKGREEENIYEGLNLDECNSTYHQIQRSLVQGPYQDVLNNDDEDIQLEKP